MDVRSEKDFNILMGYICVFALLAYLVFHLPDALYLPSQLAAILFLHNAVLFQQMIWKVRREGNEKRFIFTFPKNTTNPYAILAGAGGLMIVHAVAENALTQWTGFVSLWVTVCILFLAAVEIGVGLLFLGDIIRRMWREIHLYFVSRE